MNDVLGGAGEGAGQPSIPAVPDSMTLSSIIIPVFNREIYTRICIQSLLAALGDRRDVEIIVIDNGSTDGTPRFLQSLATPFRVITNRANRGFAAACNQGADLALGRALIFLNNDTVPLDGWLTPLEELLESPEIGLVGSKLLFPDNTIQHAGVAIDDQQTPVHLYYRFPAAYPAANVQRDYQAVTGACLAIRRSVFFDLGALDEGYVNSLEDVDLCLRARAAGLRVVYCPRSVLYHFESISEGRRRFDQANRARFLDRWGTTLTPDEAEWYRRDGYSGVPRVPARTLPQALADLAAERHRTQTLRAALSEATKVADKVGGVSHRGSADGSGPVLDVTVPTPVPPGHEIVGTGFLDRIPADFPDKLGVHYRWFLLSANVSLLEGLAGEVNMSEGHRQGEAFWLSCRAPSTDGEYRLCWTLVAEGLEAPLGHHAVTVAPRFGFSCQVHLPDQIIAGRPFMAIACLRNTGAETWLPHGGFGLGHHWFEETGQRPVIWDGPRAPILDRVAFGEETVIEATVNAPPLPGRYQLVWDAVRDGVNWFSSLGARGARQVVDVAPDPSADARMPDNIRAQEDLESRFREQLRRQDRELARLRIALESHERESTTLDSLRKQVADLGAKLTEQSARATAGEARAAAMASRTSSLQDELSEVSNWARGLERQVIEQAEQARQLERQIIEGVSWARGLEQQTTAQAEQARRLEQQIIEGANWARDLERQVIERTEQVRNLEELLLASAAQAVESQRQLAERTEQLHALESRLRLLHQAPAVRLARGLRLIRVDTD